MFGSDKYANLVKIDRRKQWKGLKEKHTKSFFKVKVNFDQNLGPTLDKYQAQIEKLLALTGKTEINALHVQPILESAAPLKKIVSAYKNSIKTLDEIARKEFGDFLTAVENDIRSWEQLAAASPANPVAPPAKGAPAATPSKVAPAIVITPQQMAAATVVFQDVDRVRQMCATIVRRGPDAIAVYEKLPNKQTAIELTGIFIEACRTAGSAANELGTISGKVVNGSNYQLFKARGKALEPLLQKVLDAATAFKEKWDPSLVENTKATDANCRALYENYIIIQAAVTTILNALHKLP